MIRKHTLHISFFAIFFLASCDAISDSEGGENYPLFIPIIEISELNALNERYHAENYDLICSTLNEYGFTGFSRVLFEGGENPCFSKPIIRKELVYSDSLLVIAKNSLVKNTEFTNVSKVEDLKLKEVLSLQGCTICEGPDINSVPLEWKFTFESQIVNDVIVSDSEIVVYVDHYGVNRIWGNWLPIIDPGFVDYGSEYALEKVIGMNLSYLNDVGEWAEQEVSYNDVIKPPKMRFSIINNQNVAEVHKVWEVSILKYQTKEIGWQISISTVTGDILETKAMYQVSNFL